MGQMFLLLHYLVVADAPTTAREDLEIFSDLAVYLVEDYTPAYSLSRYGAK